jgi:hypothetical protein
MFPVHLGQFGKQPRCLIRKMAGGRLAIGEEAFKSRGISWMPEISPAVSCASTTHGVAGGSRLPPTPQEDPANDPSADMGVGGKFPRPRPSAVASFREGVHAHAFRVAVPDPQS